MSQSLSTCMYVAPFPSHVFTDKMSRRQILYVEVTEGRAPMLNVTVDALVSSDKDVVTIQLNDNGIGK